MCIHIHIHIDINNCNNIKIKTLVTIKYNYLSFQYFLYSIYNLIILYSPKLYNNLALRKCNNVNEIYV